MIKRLCIFCFYDKEGIVDDYIKVLLDEIKTVCSDIIIVVNGSINAVGKKVFEKYTDSIVIRKNEGFDAGAYGDVVLNVLKEQLDDWDEIVLCNDTFFGPFIPMKNIFSSMEEKNTDFWGLNIFEKRMLSFIPSYFLVFRKPIIMNKDLPFFFKNRIDIKEKEIIDVYGKFEVGIFQFLKERGYRHGAYTDTDFFCFYRHPDVCVEKYNLPILKKRSFSEKCYNKDSLCNVLKYIDRHFNYDISNILEVAKRKYGFPYEKEAVLHHDAEYEGELMQFGKCAFSYEGLKEAICGKKFYIYGAGSIAMQLFHIFLKNEEFFQGFVVSDAEKISNTCIHGFPVFHYSEIDKSNLIILGVEKKLSDEIIKNISECEEIVYLWE